MNLFEALSTLDWISPIVGMMHVARGNKPISVYWSRKPPAHYERVLKRGGIRVTSKIIVAGNGFVITVPAEHEGRARQILDQAGANLA